jgi:RNA polymerase subunit RPABC4/transcription elongation factor Spt4
MLLEGAIWEGGAWENWAIFAGVLIGAYLLVMWAAALYWTYRDSGARSRDPVMQGIAVGTVLIFNLPGLLLYLILRPKATISERYEHRLEAEALLHEIREQPACPQCRRKIEDDYVTCPYCRIALRTACESCGKGLAFGWVACPYCGTDRLQPELHPGRAASSSLSADASAESSITSISRPARRASTATYTPPAPKPTADTSPTIEPATET